ELRLYRPGDDIRTMDWKVTNRLKKPHVRTYSEERERSVWLLVDQRMGMFFGSKVKMKSVVAAEIAALIAWKTLADRDSIGGIVFNDQNLVNYKPRQSVNTVVRFLESIVSMNKLLKPNRVFDDNANMLNQVVAHAEKYCSHDNLVIIISDMDGWDKKIIRHLKQLTRRNDVMLFLVFDPLETELPDVNRMLISNGQDQIEFDSRKTRIRNEFKNYFETNAQELKNELKKYKVPVITLDTTVPVQIQMQNAVHLHI
ncbi:DUF58 domain-containing protein, partial [bacterium]|nr:DUF58 domain-containing protein [bacterium]